MSLLRKPRRGATLAGAILCCVLLSACNGGESEDAAGGGAAGEPLAVVLGALDGLAAAGHSDIDGELRSPDLAWAFHGRVDLDPEPGAPGSAREAVADGDYRLCALFSSSPRSRRFVTDGGRRPFPFYSTRVYAERVGTQFEAISAGPTCSAESPSLSTVEVDGERVESPLWVADHFPSIPLELENEAALRIAGPDGGETFLHMAMLVIEEAERVVVRVSEAEKEHRYVARVDLGGLARGDPPEGAQAVFEDTRPTRTQLLAADDLRVDLVIDPSGELRQMRFSARAAGVENLPRSRVAGPRVELRLSFSARGEAAGLPAVRASAIE